MLNNNQTITISQDCALAGTKMKVLILEKNPAVALLMCCFLDKSGLLYKPLWVDTRQAFLETLDPSIAIVFAGDNLPYYSALDALRDLQERNLDITVIALTGSVSEEDAVTCIKIGVIDYLLKDHLAKLAETVENDSSIQKPKGNEPQD